MKIDVQTKINEYALLIEQIRNRLGDDADTLAVLQEIGKDIRANNIQQTKSYNSDYPAIENQIAYLKRLGSKIPEGLTKRQASKMIDDFKNPSEESEDVFEVPIRIP